MKPVKLRHTGLLSPHLIKLQFFCLREMIDERCQNKLAKNECRKYANEDEPIHCVTTSLVTIIHMLTADSNLTQTARIKTAWALSDAQKHSTFNISLNELDLQHEYNSQN